MKKILSAILIAIFALTAVSCNKRIYEPGVVTNQDESFLMIFGTYDRYPKGVTVYVDGVAHEIDKVYRNENKTHKIRPLVVEPGTHRVVIRKNVDNGVLYDRKLFVGHRNTQKIDLQ